MRLLFLWTIIVSISLAHGQSNDENTGINLDSDQQIKLSEADKFVGYDLYNELYWVSKSTLYKRGALGNFEFQELMLGPITHVDLQNPLTILVFYRQTNTLVFLDNRLNEKKRIDFNAIAEFPQAQWIFNAGSNRIWLMDQNSQSLWIYDTQKMQIITRSLPLPDLIALKCRFNDCIAQTNKQLIHLSLYGTITKKEAYTKGQIRDYNDQFLITSEENTLFDLKSNQEINFPEIRPENQINDLQLTQEFLYIYDSNVIRRFPLKIN